MNFTPENEPLFVDDGYRPNVGIIIVDESLKVFWARRAGGDGWQFPQGGIDPDESILDGMYRELEEETGFLATDVSVIARTKDWLRYDLPSRYLGVQRASGSSCQKMPFKGQKQIWFLLRLLNTNVEPNFEMSESPEFDDWCWIDYWGAIDKVVDFKRDVYNMALKELAPNLTSL
jgi:putative (di)nucleoside polyphosphate hydrolase